MDDDQNNARGTPILDVLRGILRGVVFAAWTLGLGGLWLGLRAFANPARRLRGGAHVLHLWARGLCHLLGIRVTTAGAATAAPALRVANHRGYLDIVVLAATSPALFVSKDDLAAWPVLGFLGKSLGTVFLDRRRARGVAAANMHLKGAFEAGCAVAVFPEGTSTDGGPYGTEVGTFHAALFEPARRARIPVQPVALDYRTGRAHAAWTGDATFLSHFWKLLCARGTPTVDVRITHGEPLTHARDRREAAETARARILTMLSTARP